MSTVTTSLITSVMTSVITSVGVLGYRYTEKVLLELLKLLKMLGSSGLLEAAE
jgi:hypothetical protein